MNALKGLIFDFNGVLVIDQHLHDEVFREISQKIMGRPLTVEELATSVHGRTNKLIFEFLYGRELAPDELEKAATEKELAYQEISKQQGAAYQLSPGSEALLEELKSKDIPYTIATSSPKMNVDFFEQMLALSRWFDMSKVVYDDGTVRGKPAPDLYLKAAAALNLDPAACVVIEDARSGIASAHAAGIRHIIAIGPKDTHATLASLEGVNECVETLAEVNVEALFGK